ncbi:hypothetical protein ACOSQ4_012196 [Xanthoceras sorbifolium]
MNPAEMAELCQSLSLTDVDELLSSNLKIIGERKLELCLVGKLCMNRMVSRDAFRMIIHRIWKLRQDVDVEVIGDNIFVFSFACSMDRRRALARGSWCFNHALLVLEESTGKEELTKMRFDRVMFWIQIHNTPILCMNKETCFFLGSLIGEVVEVDSSMTGWVVELEVLVLPSICQGRLWTARGVLVGIFALKIAEAADQRYLGGLKGGVTSHVGVLLNDEGLGGKGGHVQGGHETKVGAGACSCARASWGILLVTTAVNGSPLPFRFTAKTAFRESINPDPGAPISVSSEKRSCWKRRVRSSGAMEINPDMVFLSETIADVDRMEVLRVYLGFFCSGVCLLSHGFAAVTLTRSFLTLKKWEREGSDLIQEMLDRCLCDLSWRFLFACGIDVSTLRRVGWTRLCVQKLSSLCGLIQGQTGMVLCRILRVVPCDLRSSTSSKMGSTIRCLEKELDQVMKKEELFWQQHSWVAWLRSDDLNIKFFHSRASARRATNKIAGLFDSFGVWRDSRCDMEHIIVDYFSRFFQKSNGGIADC